jgi:hypothetical protein
MSIHRPSPAFVLVFLASFLAGPVSARAAEELSGIVKSVDVEGKKIVVTPTGKDAPVDVSVNAKTVMKTEPGEAIALKNLKPGDGVGVAHKGGVALSIQVAVKPDELTGHVKSVGADGKTFVVTQLGSETEATVAVNDQTSIVTTEGKKVELKELKAGDGVGIAHINSTASKIVVNPKPIAKQS